jgi:hypothetical protein
MQQRSSASAKAELSTGAFSRVVNEPGRHLDEKPASHTSGFWGPCWVATSPALQRGGYVTFQAYLDNIQAKTGKTPEDFKKLAAKKGFTEKGQLRAGVKAGEIVKWLKDEYELGHGHAMAIVALLKGSKGAAAE